MFISSFKIQRKGEFCDILAQAQSGTGKTNDLPSALQGINENLKATQSIILAPHELLQLKSN